MSMLEKRVERSVRKQSQATLALIVLIVAGIGGIVGMARWLDSHRPKPDLVPEEKLYLSAQTVRRLSLGFNGLAADWYWMRALQYVGQKIIEVPEHVQLDNLGQLDLRLLGPLLDTATTLDPQFMEPYQYAAVVLPDIDVQQAIRITKKGVAANPSAWQLYQHLGYIYWQQGDFQSAAKAYGDGARVPGAPAWMEGMKARMAAEGGSRNLAREIYGRMYEQSNSQVKEMARLRLMQLDSFDQRDLIRNVLTAFQSRTGRCPSSWRELEPILRTLRFQLDRAGAPLDPAGTAYVLLQDPCDVDLDPKSGVPYK